jgi:hypothetical protein
MALGYSYKMPLTHGAIVWPGFQLRRNSAGLA